MASVSAEVSGPLASVIAFGGLTAWWLVSNQAEEPHNLGQGITKYLLSGFTIFNSIQAQVTNLVYGNSESASNIQTVSDGKIADNGPDMDGESLISIQSNKEANHTALETPSFFHEQTTPGQQSTQMFPSAFHTEIQEPCIAGVDCGRSGTDSLVRELEELSLMRDLELELVRARDEIALKDAENRSCKEHRARQERESSQLAATNPAPAEAPQRRHCSDESRQKLSGGPEPLGGLEAPKAPVDSLGGAAAAEVGGGGGDTAPTRAVQVAATRGPEMRRFGNRMPRCVPTRTRGARRQARAHARACRRCIRRSGTEHAEARARARDVCVTCVYARARGRRMPIGAMANRVLSAP